MSKNHIVFYMFSQHKAEVMMIEHYTDVVQLDQCFWLSFSIDGYWCC